MSDRIARIAALVTMLAFVVFAISLTADGEQCPKATYSAVTNIFGFIWFTGTVVGASAVLIGAALRGNRG